MPLDSERLRRRKRRDVSAIVVGGVGVLVGGLAGGIPLWFTVGVPVALFAGALGVHFFLEWLIRLENSGPGRHL